MFPHYNKRIFLEMPIERSLHKIENFATLYTLDRSFIQVFDNIFELVWLPLIVVETEARMTLVSFFIGIEPFSFLS